MEYKVGDRVIITTEFGLFKIETKAIVIRVKEIKHSLEKSYRIRYKLGYKSKNSTYSEKGFKLDIQYYRNLKLNNLLNEL